MKFTSPECRFACISTYDGRGPSYGERGCSGKAVNFWISSHTDEIECFCEAHKELAWGMHNPGWYEISCEEYFVFEIMQS